MFGWVISAETRAAVLFLTPCISDGDAGPSMNFGTAGGAGKCAGQGGAAEAKQKNCRIMGKIVERGIAIPSFLCYTE